jgi:uncharacterized protein (DUF302 family)
MQRLSRVSAKPFDEVVARIESALGHPEIGAFQKSMAAARSEAELQGVVAAALGPSGLIEFARFDLGEVLRQARRARTARVLRLIVGNPLIMKEMVGRVPDAGSYAPVTILIDEREDGVHLSYDTMASFLAPYGEQGALKVARELDARIESLLAAVA